VVADLHLRLRIYLRVHAHLGLLPVLERGDRRHGARLGAQAAEVAADQLACLRRVEVTDDDADEVVRPVVDVPVALRLLHRVAVEVARPADDGPRVAARHPEHRIELLLEDARGGALGAQAPLLVHDVALAVELAEHAVVEPVALHPRPELELVARDVDEVEGEVVRGEGIHARASLARVHLVELVLHDGTGGLLIALELRNLRLDLLRPRCPLGRGAVSLREFLLQRGDALGVGPALLRVHQRLQLCPHLRQLRRVVRGVPWVVDLPDEVAHVLRRPRVVVDCVAQRLLARAELGIALGVLRADGVRALEHHVLEEVRDARDAGALVDAADLREPSCAYGVRLVRARDEQELHPVVEDHDLGLDLLGAGDLRPEADGGKRRCGDDGAGDRARVKGDGGGRGGAHDVGLGGGVAEHAVVRQVSRSRRGSRYGNSVSAGPIRADRALPALAPVALGDKVGTWCPMGELVGGVRVSPCWVRVSPCLVRLSALRRKARSG